MDPLSPAALWKDAWFSYALAGERQRFLERTDELERLLPNDPRASQIRAWVAATEGRALDWDRLVTKVIESDPSNQANHCYLAADYDALASVRDAALYHANICSRLSPENTAGLFNIARIQLHAGDLPAAGATVNEALARGPEDRFTRLAQIQLQYYANDCAAVLQSIAQARPALSRREGALDLVLGDPDADLFVWCSRQRGNGAQAARMNRDYRKQNAPSVTPGLYQSGLARMAAASGDRDELVARLRALIRTPSMSFTFARHEPMIQPYLKDSDVAALLDALDVRRAQWRKVLPKSSMRVPVPGITVPGP